MFLRRIHLDLVGMIPVYEETTAFLGDTDPEKRAKLIDRLLVDPRYGRQQAQVFDLAILTRDLVVDPSWAINAAGAPHPSAFQALQRLSLTPSTPSASV